MGAWTNPTVSDFKTYFARDFVFGVAPNTVTDSDVSRCIQDAAVSINTNLFQSQDAYNTGFLNLAAHNLVMNLRAASQGTQGQFPWMQTGKSVGSVSESLQIPERIMANPEFAMLTKTYYGAKYLFMILPQLTGQMFTVIGFANVNDAYNGGYGYGGGFGVY